MTFSRFIRLVLLVTLIGVIGGSLYVWNYIGMQTEPVLTPINQEYVAYSHVPTKAPGLKLEPFSFKGWDGKEVPAVLVVQDGEESTRQLTVSAELARKKADDLRHIDYVLVSVEWDHGIRSALPLAETLTAAGLRCVLWEPRARHDARPYCTHGLKESGDIPHLIDALLQQCPETDPTIVAVAQGFGAGMILQAAATEPRIQGIVSIDAYSSLRQSVERMMPKSPLTKLVITLMDLRIKHSVGYESFDVAPVESASYIAASTPLLLVNLEQNNPTRTLDDAICLYRRTQCKFREVWTLRTPEDKPDATERSVVYKTKEGPEEIIVKLLPNRESAEPAIIRWMNDVMVPAIEAPHIPTPQRPVLTPDTHL